MLYLFGSQNRSYFALPTRFLYDLHHVLVHPYLYYVLAIIVLESNLTFNSTSYRNETHNKCPICQSNLGSVNDSWVLAELPQTNEVSEEIITELNALTAGSSSEGEVNPNQDARDDYDSDD